MFHKRKAQRQDIKVNIADKKGNNKSPSDKYESKPRGKSSRSVCSCTTTKKIISFLFVILNFGIYFFELHPHDGSDANLRRVVKESNSVTGDTDDGVVDASEKVIESAVKFSDKPARPVENPKSTSTTGATSLNEKTMANAANSDRDRGSVDTSEKVIESTVKPAKHVENPKPASITGATTLKENGDTKKKVIVSSVKPVKPVKNPKSTSIIGGTTLNEKAIKSVLSSGRKNVALKKTATASETHNANNAVDGNRKTKITHTKGCNPWWSVAFDSVRDVKDVIIFNRKGSYGDRLIDFNVEVMTKVSGKWKVVANIGHLGPAPEIVGFNFEPSAKGERVKVSMKGCDKSFLHMLQVEVYEPAVFEYRIS